MNKLIVIALAAISTQSCTIGAGNEKLQNSPRKVTCEFNAFHSTHIKWIDTSYTKGDIIKMQIDSVDTYCVVMN